MLSSPPRRLSDIIETRPCNRCGGNGRLTVYIDVLGGTCFKCHGSGRLDTKRGAAARAFYQWMRELPASALRADDQIYEDAIPGMGFAGGWVTVRQVTDVAAHPDAASSCHLYRVSEIDKIIEAVDRGATVLPREDPLDGERCVKVYEGLRIDCGTTVRVVSRDYVLAIGVDSGLHRAMLHTVARYQSSLTKAGKPRKGTG